MTVKELPVPRWRSDVAIHGFGVSGAHWIAALRSQ
jgi:hypothetical protein